MNTDQMRFLTSANRADGHSSITTSSHTTSLIEKRKRMRERGRERGREGEKGEREREEGREGGREEGRERKREERKKEGRERGREKGREGRREGGREGGRGEESRYLMVLSNLDKLSSEYLCEIVNPGNTACKRINT